MKLQCSVCGGLAPAKKQWPQQDTGYGCCPRCYAESVKRDGAEEAKRYYGIAGIHHSLPLRQAIREVVKDHNDKVMLNALKQIIPCKQ